MGEVAICVRDDGLAAGRHILSVAAHRVRFRPVFSTESETPADPELSRSTLESVDELFTEAFRCPGTQRQHIENGQQGVPGQPAFCGFLGRRGITHFLVSLEFSRQRVPAHRRSL